MHTLALVIVAIFCYICQRVFTSFFMDHSCPIQHKDASQWSAVYTFIQFVQYYSFIQMKKLSGIIAKHKTSRLNGLVKWCWRCWCAHSADSNDCVHQERLHVSWKFTTPWVREGLPSPFEREVANLGACLDSSKSSHAKQATAWPCLKLTVSPSPSLRFVVRRLYQTIA